MTQEDNLSAQTVSDALVSGTDTISEAQKNLGTEGTAETVTFSREEVEARIKEAVSSVQSEVRGLQGALDRTTKTVTDMTQAAQSQQAESLIASLPEEQQQFARYQEQQLQENRRLLVDMATKQAAKPVTPTLDENTAALVAEYGLSPTDPRLDFNAYGEKSIAGTKKFLDSVQRAAGNTAPQNTQPVVKPPSPDAAPQASGAGLTTEDGIREAFITGKIDATQFVDGMKGIGVQV